MIEVMKLAAIREEIDLALGNLMDAQKEIVEMITKLEMLQILAGGQENG